MSGRSRERHTLHQISESSTVRLGLAITMLVGVVWLVSTINGVRADVADKYVSKEMFTARLDEIVRATTDLKAEFRQMRDEVRAIQSTVSSISAREQK
jgi:hypothetical protein